MDGVQRSFWSLFLQPQLTLEHQTVGRLPVWSVFLYPLGSYDSCIFTTLSFLIVLLSCLFFFVLPHGPTVLFLLSFPRLEDLVVRY